MLQPPTNCFCEERRHCERGHACWIGRCVCPRRSARGVNRKW